MTLMYQCLWRNEKLNKNVACLFLCNILSVDVLTVVDQPGKHKDVIVLESFSDD